MSVVYTLVYLHCFLAESRYTCKEQEKYAKNSKSVSHIWTQEAVRNKRISKYVNTTLEPLIPLL